MSTETTTTETPAPEPASDLASLRAELAAKYAPEPDPDAAPPGEPPPEPATAEPEKPPEPEKPDLLIAELSAELAKKYSKDELETAFNKLLATKYSKDELEAAFNRLGGPEEHERVGEIIELRRRKRDIEKRARDLDAREAKVKDLDELRELAERDPLAFAARLKIDPYEWAQKATKSPEALRLEKLEAELAAERAERTKRAEADAAERAKAQDLATIGGVLRGSLDGLPTLAAYLADGEFTEQQLTEAVYVDALDEYQQTGAAPDVKGLLRRLEQGYAARLDREAARVARLRPTPAPAAPPAGKTPPAARQAPAATLSNADASARSGEEPKTLEELQRTLIQRHLQTPG